MSIFQYFGHFFIPSLFFLYAQGALKVGGPQELELVYNHAHFGAEPPSILAKIERKCKKIKKFVFFFTPFLRFLAFFESL